MSLICGGSLRLIKSQMAYRRVCSLLLSIPAASLSPRRSIARWVAPTLMEMNARKRKFNLPEPSQRSGFLEWNFPAEIYAFNARLNENFKLELLTQAFVQRSYIVREELRQREVGIDEPVLNLKDNLELAKRGEEIVHKYVTAFVRSHLPLYPDAGVKAVKDFLLSREKLAYISSHLGTKEIILAAEYPPSEESMAVTLYAIVGALSESQTDGSLTRPYNFVRDFVCTELNQVDINDLWTIEKPFELLKEVCNEHNIAGSLEPRIIGETAKNTILATCHIGIYDANTKKLLGTGFGENYPNAIDVASIHALAKIFGTHNLKPFNYKIDADECFARANSLSGSSRKRVAAT